MVIFMENKETFNYTYSAKEQKEIQEIRKKYEVTEGKEDKMATLRRMDAEVTQKATVVSLVFGVVGTLIMGMGMSFAMTDIGATFGFSGRLSMIVGIFIGVVGMVVLGVAYPLYNLVLKKEREKIAPEIIRISDELMK